MYTLEGPKYNCQAAWVLYHHPVTKVRAHVGSLTSRNQAQVGSARIVPPQATSVHLTVEQLDLTPEQEGEYKATLLNSQDLA